MQTYMTNLIMNYGQYKGKSQKKLYQELNLESLRNRRRYRKLFFSIKSKINSPQHVIILICIKTIQVQLIAPDHHQMKI